MPRRSRTLCASIGSQALQSPLRLRLRDHDRGRGLNYRRVGEAFRKAVTTAGIQAPGNLTLHSLRHTFASYLIASGLDVVFVSRQLGHAHPGITLEVYSHLFAARDHAASARNALDASHAAINGLRAPERPCFMETAVETDATRTEERIPQVQPRSARTG